MAFIALLEMVLVAGLIYLVVSQLLLPALKGEPLCPLMWAKQAQLDAEKARLLQQLAEQDTEKDVEQLREQLKRKERA